MTAHSSLRLSSVKAPQRRTTSDKPTQFPELNELLQGRVESISEVLDDNSVGTYLVGSFALGDADIHSDVDFLVVVRNSLTPSEEGRLRALHRKIFRRPGHWTQHLEGSYVPENEFRSPDGLGNRWLYLDNAHEEVEWSTHCNSLEHGWTLRERGIILAGPSLRGLVEKVDPDAIREKMRQLIQTFLPELAAWIRLNSIAWAQRYAVATLCRMLYSIATGEIASKRASLIWAKEHLDPAWSDPARARRPTPGWDPNDLPSNESVQQTIPFAEYARAWATAA